MIAVYSRGRVVWSPSEDIVDYQELLNSFIA